MRAGFSGSLPALVGRRKSALHLVRFSRNDHPRAGQQRRYCTRDEKRICPIDPFDQSAEHFVGGGDTQQGGSGDEAVSQRAPGQGSPVRHCPGATGMQ